MNLDIAITLDLLTHQLSQSLLLELSIVKDIPITQKASNIQYDQFLNILELTSRGFGISDLLENWRYVRNLKLSDFLNILAGKKQNYLCVKKLSKILDFINEQFNESILSPLFVLNGPNGIEMKQSITNSQLNSIEEIYLLFDEEGKGYIEGDRILLLFQVLLFAKESPNRFRSDDYLIYKKQYLQFCEIIGIYEGKLPIRLFKQYFVVNQLIGEQIFQQIKYYFYQFVGFQRFKLIDKAFYLAITLSSKQKALWMTNIKNKIDSSNFIREIQKSKKFNKLLFENMVLCEQYVRILYLFLIENFESLKFYFDQEKRYDLQFFSDELTRIFNSSYSQHQAILTMVDNISILFLIFSDAYSVIFKENMKLFSSIYSSYQQEKSLPQSQIKQISLKSTPDKANSIIKSFQIDLEIPDYKINKNKSENYIFEKKSIIEEDPDSINEMTQIIEKNSQIISPIKSNIYKQYSNSNSQLESPIRQNTLNNISYLTNPQLRSNNHIFSPIKLNGMKSNNTSSNQYSPNQNYYKNSIKLSETQSQIQDNNQQKIYSNSSKQTPQREILQKTHSLSPQKQIGGFSYLDYLKSSIETKKQTEKNDMKVSKVQSMIKSGWVELPQKQIINNEQNKQYGQGIHQVYNSLRVLKPAQAN